MSNVVIEDYSPKSFVVRGDTREHKNSLKALGGKWNSVLTDKNTGEKFGAWLFWSNKRKEIEDWIDKDFPKIESENDDNIVKRLESLENRLAKLEMLKIPKQEVSADDEIIDDEIPIKPKRLLSKSKK